jgi:gliding motility-associated lipoprotein GldD
MPGKAKLILISLVLIFMVSCGDTPVPKPRGYFRISLPEKSYVALDTSFPYAFEYPEYAEITPDPHAPGEPYWINVNFPEYKGQLHLSYKIVDDTNLIDYMEDSRKFVIRHIPKASAINDSLIYDRDRDLYGIFYEIRGVGAASPFQFFVTDSTTHFVRGALYFTVRPNNDSLAPVIDFLKEDIEHLLLTFRWK